MNLKKRIEKLEEEYGQSGEEVIVYVTKYADSKELPNPEEEIARQRAEGKKLIVVAVPENYELKEKEGHDHEY